MMTNYVNFGRNIKVLQKYLLGRQHLLRIKTRVPACKACASGLEAHFPAPFYKRMWNSSRKVNILQNIS